MEDPALYQQWVGEVGEMRERIKAMRQKLYDVLSAKVPGRDFSYFIKQRGMFSYTGLTVEQVLRLREEFAVYLVNSGRMCVAGLNQSNVDYVAWDGDTGQEPPEGISEVAQRQTDRGILATRRAVYPLHGLDPEDPRD